ncbi:MAG: Fe-S cluster assembly protein SufD [Actinomycetota bacterium]
MASTLSFDKQSINAIADRAGDPGWLADMRREAFDRFESLPWPDSSVEAWKYSSLAGFRLEDHLPGQGDHGHVETIGRVHADVRAQMSITGECIGNAVQVDGDVVLTALDESVAAQGVIFSTLSEAAVKHEDLVRDSLGKAGTTQSDEKLLTLIQAFGGAGLFVYVPRGVEVDLPLHMFRYLTQAGRALLSRSVVVLEEGARITLIEHMRSPHHGASSLSAVSAEILAKQSAGLQYLTVQDYAPSVWHFGVTRAMVGRDASLRTLAATLGSRFSRGVVESVLHGTGAYSEMLGVYFGDGSQHFDHRSLQQHIAPNAKSDLYYKGALKGTSSAVYSGLIHIAKDAQGSDAWQANRNLILSDQAKADSIPYLEIEANDVRCAHGASVGPPDEDTLFYLNSRGLDAQAAERLVVTGFFQEVLDRVRVGAVREALEAAVEAELAL